MNLDDITRKLGVDSLGYISLDGLKTACSKCVLPFCDVCFTGDGVLAHTKKNIFE
jgi:amidophosphoribosyltransferase